MKKVIGIVLSLIAGGLIGFFGVMVSVFADAGADERLLTIAAVLLLYFFLSGIWGFLLPDFSAKWGFFIGAPGVLLLVATVIKEYNFYYLMYMILIIGLSCFGAWGGSWIRKRGKKS
jgi:hypothetical protein